MTPRQFSERLGKLIQHANQDGVCGLCVLIALSYALEAVHNAVQPTDEAMQAHGLPPLEVAQAHGFFSPRSPPKGLH